jgi:nucleotidyltransferase substrate binding protein (TIGR01987 family)
MILDLSALRDALAALEKSLSYLHSDLAKDEGLRDQFRAACIQAFEFTYEVSYKMLKRQLEQMAGVTAEIDHMTFMQLIRTGAEAGLIADIGRFKNYRDKRNLTSHTYNKQRAAEIAQTLPDFVRDARYLLTELEARNRASG